MRRLNRSLSASMAPGAQPPGAHESVTLPGSAPQRISGLRSEAE
jgi:hypothetical protein